MPELTVVIVQMMLEFLYKCVKYSHSHFIYLNMLDHKLCYMQLNQYAVSPLVYIT